MRFAIILLGVGLATALAAGAVAGYETERAANQQLVDDGHNTASLGAQLVRLDSAGSSAAFACQVASLGATQSAFAAGAAAAQTLAAQEASASTGQLVLFVAADGSVLGEAPTVLARAQLADLRSSLGGGVGCSGSKAGGFFWRPAPDSLYGVGAARVSRSGLELGTVIVLTRVDPATVNFARRLAQIDAPSAKLLVVAGGRILVGPAVPGLLSGAGSRLPGSLAAVLKSSRSRGTTARPGRSSTPIRPTSCCAASPGSSCSRSWGRSASRPCAWPSGGSPSSTTTAW